MSRIMANDRDKVSSSSPWVCTILSRLSAFASKLYFPEIEHFIRSDHSDWLTQLLLRYPTPGAITSLPQDASAGLSLIGFEFYSELVSKQRSKPWLSNFVVEDVRCCRPRRYSGRGG